MRLIMWTTLRGFAVLGLKDVGGRRVGLVLEDASYKGVSMVNVNVLGGKKGGGGSKSGGF